MAILLIDIHGFSHLDGFDMGEKNFEKDLHRGSSVTIPFLLLFLNSLFCLLYSDY